MPKVLGRPLDEALSSLPEGCAAPRITHTAAPVRPGQERRGGRPRVIAIWDDEWIVAEFWDAAPKEKEEAWQRADCPGM